MKKWIKSQGDLDHETELSGLERQRRGKKKCDNTIKKYKQTNSY